MDYNKIYEKILSIAIDLCSKNETCTRAALSQELEELGIEYDSYDVSKLIESAYAFFNNDKHIRKAYLDNEGERNIIDECHIRQLISKKNFNRAFKQIDNELEKGNKALIRLQQTIDNIPNEKEIKVKVGILPYVTCTADIQKIKGKVMVYSELYPQMMLAYDNAKTDVKVAIKDFIEIRNYVVGLYREVAMKLVDVFGDSIRQVSPQLFDFQSVEFLDVGKMYEAIKSKSDDIIKNCATILGEAPQKFIEGASKSLRLYRENKENISYAHLMSMAEMSKYYVEVVKKKGEVKSNFEKLKQDIEHDVTTIAGDYARLASIYKLLNDLFIPQAVSFYRYSHDIFSHELEQMFATLYSDESISIPAKKRTSLIEECKEIERKIIDHQLHIEYYVSAKKNNQEFLENIKEKFEESQTSKPQEPNRFKAFFTFGKATKKYEDKFKEWHVYYDPIIKKYDEVNAKLVVSEKELFNHRLCLSSACQDLHDKQEEIDALNGEISEKLKVSDDVRTQLCRHLGDLVKLLHIAKSIAESKLDSKQTHIVKVKDYRNMDLPKDVEDNLDKFVQSIKDNVKKHIVKKEEDKGKKKVEDKGKTVVKEGDEQKNVSQEEKKEILKNQSIELLVENCADILHKTIKLQLLQKQGNVVKEKYMNELRSIRGEFNKVMLSTDAKSAVLLEAMRKLNTSTDKNDLKEALLLLGYEDDLSDDIERFLKGDTQIEI